jgi:pimeloyl-ACP methyl ester carboxylesterase
LHVVTFDYPGIGYSAGQLPDDIGKAASFVADFANALGIDRFAMMGWSWGGATAQAVMLDQPQRVTHAIILGANPPGPVERPIQQAFIERALKPVNDLADEEVLFFEPKSEFSRRAAKASRDRIYARPGVAEKIPSTIDQIQAYLKAAAPFSADKAGRRAALAQTRTPILVVAGDNDISTAGQNWFPLVGQIPNAQLLVHPESGHGPQHQYPELTALYISNFLTLTR